MNTRRSGPIAKSEQTTQGDEVYRYRKLIQFVSSKIQKCTFEIDQMLQKYTRLINRTRHLFTFDEQMSLENQMVELKNRTLTKQKQQREIAQIFTLKQSLQAKNKEIMQLFQQRESLQNVLSEQIENNINKLKTQTIQALNLRRNYKVNTQQVRSSIVFLSIDHCRQVSFNNNNDGQFSDEKQNKNRDNQSYNQKEGEGDGNVIWKSFQEQSSKNLEFFSSRSNSCSGSNNSNSSSDTESYRSVDGKHPKARTHYQIDSKKDKIEIQHQNQQNKIESQHSSQSQQLQQTSSIISEKQKDSGEAKTTDIIATNKINEQQSELEPQRKNKTDYFNRNIIRNDFQMKKKKTKTKKQFQKQKKKQKEKQKDKQKEKEKLRYNKIQPIKIDRQFMSQNEQKMKMRTKMNRNMNMNFGFKKDKNIYNVKQQKLLSQIDFENYFKKNFNRSSKNNGPPRYIQIISESDSIVLDDENDYFVEKPKTSSKPQLSQQPQPKPQSQQQKLRNRTNNCKPQTAEQLLGVQKSEVEENSDDKSVKIHNNNLNHNRVNKHCFQIYHDDNNKTLVQNRKKKIVDSIVILDD